jgi:transposase
VRLERIVADRNSVTKHVYRARIVLLAGDGLGTTRIAHRVGKSEPTVRRWLERFAAQGVDGLLRDATRPPGRPPLAKVVVERVVHMTLHEPPPDATQWSARRLAKALGIGHGAVQKIWAGHGLKPHLVRRFKLSSDPDFAVKLRDVVGLYIDPPERALVLSVDEKSQMQALDRTQPGLPMKKGRAGTMTYDYKRHGTTTLFAALDILSGKVMGQCMLKHRAIEFVRFLRRIDKATPPELDLHLILDNWQFFTPQQRERLSAYVAMTWRRSEDRRWFAQMGLTLNEQKTRLCDGRREPFTFLGYTFGPMHYRKDGHWYLGARPAKKAVSRIKGRIRQILRPSNQASWEEVVAELNPVLRGWAQYFAYGTRLMAYRAVDHYVWERVRHFLRRRHKVPSRGTRRFTGDVVFGELGVYRLRRFHLGSPVHARV